MENPSKLEFVPFVSSVNPSFWNKFTEIKLEVDQLSEAGRHIWGYFSNLAQISSPRTILEVDSTSFNNEASCLPPTLAAHGTLINLNTSERFKEYNKMDLITEEGNNFVSNVKNGKVLLDPSLINFFVILSFADLKKYHFYYWFAFPVPANNLSSYIRITPITCSFNESQLVELCTAYDSLPLKDKTHFIIENINNGVKVTNLSSKILYPENNLTLNREGIYFAYADVSSSQVHPGWPLRNFLYVISYYCPELRGEYISIISFRLFRCASLVTCNSSLVLKIQIPEFQDIEWTGWEKNEKGNFGPHFTNMKKHMDPTMIANATVDLNLKLMKWREAPNLNLEKIANSKCLLLGAGTLGCSVARTLMGWGVRNITFVDNGAVSFSNPVRQSLYTYDDAVMGAPKAETAANALKKIFPGINAVGINLDIVMPGHPLGEVLLKKAERDVKQLTTLIQDHDVIFLLTDSRESRWLPSVIGHQFNKIVITAALGFDSYVIMRHGARRSSTTTIKPTTSTKKEYKLVPGENLSCYFCCDVTAPGNSMVERSLDQQCTVTRPGISGIAGSLAAELAISVLQNPLSSWAPAYYCTSAEGLSSSSLPEDTVFNVIPHVIRGYLSNFTQIMPTTERYDHCVACSVTVLDEFVAGGFDFVKKVCDSSKYLEELLGLDKMFDDNDMKQILELDSDCEVSD